MAIEISGSLPQMICETIIMVAVIVAGAYVIGKFFDALKDS